MGAIIINVAVKQTSVQIQAHVGGFLCGSGVKNLPAAQGFRLHPWVGKIPWRRPWQPTPVFLLGKSHGQRSLAGCGPWGHREWTRLEGWKWLSKHAQTNVVLLQVHGVLMADSLDRVGTMGYPFGEKSCILRIKWSRSVVSDSLWPHRL